MNDVAFIDAERANYKVTELCDALDVAPSGYYAAQHREKSMRKHEDEILVPKIRQAFLASRKTYGSLGFIWSWWRMECKLVAIAWLG